MYAKPFIALIATAAALLLQGCSNIERSRDTANPRVSAITLAQQVCSNCHGLTGNAESPNFPNLAGQITAYTAAQLQAFKSHDRHDPAGYEYMWGLSRSLSEEQIQGLAAYYAAQAPTLQAREGRPSRVDAGRAIFENGLAAQSVPACGGCHGDKAQGQAGFPRLAGQHANYLAKQLQGFARGDDRPGGAMMQPVAHALTAQDINNVAAYLQAMPGL